MRYMTFQHGDTTRAGVISGESDADVVDLTVALGTRFRDIRDVIEGGTDVWDAARLAHTSPTGESLVPLDSVAVCAPLPRPVRIRDCTLFTEHLAPSMRQLAERRAAATSDPEAELRRLEAAGECDLPELLTKQPVYYTSDHLSVSGPDDLITAPRTSRFLDYELEYAAVLGTGGRNIAESDAAAHIFGYSIMNDWSLRDVQGAVMSTRLGPAGGKDFEGGNTFGPYVVTPDEVQNPYVLEMVARVDGVEWSRGNSRSISFTFERAIAHLSVDREMYAGEIIGSGTVLSGSGYELGRTLTDGATVELEIERLGTLRNKVAVMSDE
nr:fumarylacetoacetate hydrolase family protein [uncultured Rhodococcus sp.]